MNRFFITTLFTLFAATQLSSVHAMKRAHDDTYNSNTQAQTLNFITTIKALPPEMQLHAITWMLDVDTPENLLNSLIMMCNCARIDTDFNALATDQTLGYCLKIRLHNTGQSLTTLLNANNETVLHLLARRPDFNARLFNVIQIAAGNQFNNLVSMQNIFENTALHLAALNGHATCTQVLLSVPGVNKQQFVSMQDVLHNTALHRAAWNGHTACVQTFLNTPGINVQQLIFIQDFYHNTALIIAQQQGHQDIVALLQPYIAPHQN